MENSQQDTCDISACFVRHFGRPDRAPLAIWKSGGIEVNSSNFRIDTMNGRYLLKRLSLTRDQMLTTENQQSLVAWLYEIGIPVPRPIRSKENTYLCLTENNDCWAAMSFVEGRFFEGGVSSLQNAACAIGRLHRVLQTRLDTAALGRHYVHLSEDDAQLFAEVLTNQHAKLPSFSDKDVLLLRKSHSILSRAWDMVSAHRDAFRSAPIGLIHIDLHPHNILMKGDSVSTFLDFNSLKIGPLNMMLGFSAYKLLRQSVQYTDPGMGTAKCQTLTDKFLDCYFDEFPDFSAPRESIGNFALAEVCRRLGIIFRLNLRYRNTLWNHMLKVHLTGIREIGQLFGLNWDTQ